MLTSQSGFDNIAHRVFEQLLNGKFLRQELDISDFDSW